LFTRKANITVMRTAKQGIYWILNQSTGKVYVGSATHIHARWRWHVKALDAGTHPNRYLQRAWTKYGKETFEFDIVELVEDRIWLRVHEHVWIKKLKARTNSRGYNIASSTFCSFDGFVEDEALRKRHKKATKAAMLRPEVIERMREAQRKRFADPIKRAEFRKAFQSPEARKRRSKAAKEWMNDPLKNATLKEVITSAEHTKKRAAGVRRAYQEDPERRTRKAKWAKEWHADVENKQKHSAAQKKLYEDQSERDKQAAAQTKRYASPEERQKSSRAMKSSWYRRRLAKAKLSDPQLST
jgi:group I intron endonuclease